MGVRNTRVSQFSHALVWNGDKIGSGKMFYRWYSFEFSVSKINLGIYGSVFRLWRRLFQVNMSIEEEYV